MEKHLHAIWFGPNKMAPDNEANLALWAKLHPGWTITLWTEKSAINLLLEHGMHDAVMLMSKFPSYAAKSDIFRLAVLLIMGGVYIDGDMEPVRNIEPLITYEDPQCFVGWEQNGKRINNAVIGASIGNSAVRDALDNLRCHIEDAKVNRMDAAYATGPHYLTEIWKEDFRVTKFPREVFYPYDWHEPWKAQWTIGPDTYAIHRWDASWIGEIPKHQRELRLHRIALCVVGATDEARTKLVWESHLHQSVLMSSVVRFREELAWLQADSNFYNHLVGLTRQGVKRILFVPADHVLDRNTVEAHAWLPQNRIGITASRLFSSSKLFDPHCRRANVFPFEVFRYHGFDPGARLLGDHRDADEVFSVPVETAFKVLAEEKDRLQSQPTWKDFAYEFVCSASFHSEITHTYKTRTTKLCQHPVNETAGDAHVPQWDGKEIIQP